MIALLSATVAYDNGRGRTPPMGWNSWCTGERAGTQSLCNAFGADPCTETMVREVADAMVSEGMVDLGYNYLSLDDCWSAKTRNASGHLQPDPKQFPNGMAAVADYVHARNLSFGLYTCVGTKTCKGDRPGSFGNYELDAQTLASWGVDLVKMDHCGYPGGNHTDQELYGEMSRALNATGRSILFSLCSWGTANVWEWGGDVAQMARIQQDHLPLWYFPQKQSGQGGYGSGTANIIEWMADLVPSKWTKQFGWLDPDFLMTLFSPTMNYVNSRTEYSFWALWSAPLLVSTDVRKMSDEKRAILKNKEVIAIDQDASNTAGDRVRKDDSGGQLWARPLAGGDKAAIVYNAGKGLRPKDIDVAVTWAELGWPADAKVRVRDLWSQQDVGEFVGGWNATAIAPHDVQFVRLSLVSDATSLATGASTRFPAPPGGANGGGISVSLLPFLPVDQNITLSLQSSALLYGTWSTPPQSALYPVWSKTGTSLQGFRAEGAPYVDANVTYAWTDAGGSQHQLSLAFQSGPGGYFVHTEWYVPGFEATTLGVMIGPDFALSVIYAAGDSPPLPCPPKE